MGIIRRAFTLVELLIVIIVIAVLAAIVVPKFQLSGLKAREASLKATLAIYRGVIERYRADTGLFPMVPSDVTDGTPPALGMDSTGASVPMPAGAWQGPYLASFQLDPVSGLSWNYSSTPPTVGRIQSLSPGISTEGTLYSSW